jgi:LuxR family transcriptional regulator, maltose regulon positive regulatory protein
VAEASGRSYERGFAPPPPRPGDVARQAILARAATEHARRIVLIDGPAGYGKTTFAAQACAQDGRPAAWITLRDSDNDPVRFLTRLVRALAEAGGIDPRLRPPETAATSAAGAAELLARLLDALPGGQPVQLVLDDVHAVHQAPALGVLRSVAWEWPARSRLVLVSRIEPDVSVGRLRASHELSEVHFAELALDKHETAEVLSRASVSWPQGAVEELHSRTEGWAAGIALAAMVRPGPGETAVPIGLPGTAREVAGYFFDEVLRRQAPVLREFMLSTSVVGRLSAPLCDAMTNRSDSAGLLAQLEHDNAFVVPLDRQRTWYRYHHLFREMLGAELGRQFPEAARGLLDRAAAWHERDGGADEAFEYARAIGDFDRAGRVLMRNMEELVSWGHFETARRWLDRCGDDEIESDPKLAIGAGWFAGHLGEAERARRYVRAAQRFDLDVPSPDEASTLRASMINLRSTLGLDGVSQMLDDGLSLLASEAPAGTRWLRSGYRICGAAQIMLGRTQEAIESFEQMVWLTEDNDQRRAGRAFCLGYLGLACIELGDWPRARRYCDEAAEVMRDHESTVDGLPVRMARAAILARDGDVAEAARHLAALQPLLARMRSSPLLCADLSARCAEIAHEAGQREAALALYEAARRACSQVPDAGAIPLRLGRLERRMSPGSRPQASLTPAEMRVLRQLATHRTLQEIAQHLHVSRSTVKTQVASIHAKLGVTSRAQAVEAAGLGPIPGPDQATS